jgi:hypothetical protein
MGNGRSPMISDLVQTCWELLFEMSDVNTKKFLGSPRALFFLLKLLAGVEKNLTKITI